MARGGAASETVGFNVLDPTKVEDCSTPNYG